MRPGSAAVKTQVLGACRFEVADVRPGFARWLEYSHVRPGFEVLVVETQAGVRAGGRLKV